MCVCRAPAGVSHDKVGCRHWRASCAAARQRRKRSSMGRGARRDLQPPFPPPGRGDAWRAPYTPLLEGSLAHVTHRAHVMMVHAAKSRPNRSVTAGETGMAQRRIRSVQGQHSAAGRPQPPTVNNVDCLPGPPRTQLWLSGDHRRLELVGVEDANDHCAGRKRQPSGGQGHQQFPCHAQAEASAHAQTEAPTRAWGVGEMRVESTGEGGRAIPARKRRQATNTSQICKAFAMTPAACCCRPLSWPDLKQMRVELPTGPCVGCGALLKRYSVSYGAALKTKPGQVRHFTGCVQ